MVTHPIPDAALAECVALVGRTGAGKSYTARGMAERVLERGERLCILDPTGVWWGLRLARDGKAPGYKVVVFGGDYADVQIGDASGAPLAQLLAARNLPAVVDLSGFTMGGRVRFATAFLEEIYRANRREPLTLVVDEADIFAPQRAMPDQTVMLSRMEQIVRRGRVRGFRPWLITQRPAELHKSVLSQAATLVALWLTAPQDRKAIEGWVLGHGDRDQAAKVLGSLAGLSRGEGWVWSPGLNLLERVTLPVIRTYDSMRTPEVGQEHPAPASLSEIDLSALQDSLRAVEAEAAANDPKALRKRIAELEAENRRLVARVVDPEAVDQARQSGYQDGYRTGREHGWNAGTSAALTATRKAVEAVSFPMTPPPEEQAQAPYDPVPQVVARDPNRDANYARSYAAPPAPTMPAIREGLSRPQQRIVDALAWLESVGIGQADRTRAAMLADQSPRSSGFEKNVSTLSTRGYIGYPAPGFLALTAHGREIANRPQRFPSTEELQVAIRAKISGPQWRILEALIATHPNALSREELAQRSGQSETSSGFEKNVSTLRSLGFVDYPARGHVAAAAILFL